MTQNEIDELWKALDEGPDIFISKPANIDRLIDYYHQQLADYESNPTARKRGTKPAAEPVKLSRDEIMVQLGYEAPKAPAKPRRRI